MLLGLHHHFHPDSLNCRAQGLVATLERKTVRDQARQLDPADVPVVTKCALMARFDDWVTDPEVNLAGVEAFLADRDRIGALGLTADQVESALANAYSTIQVSTIEVRGTRYGTLSSESPALPGSQSRTPFSAG